MVFEDIEKTQVPRKKRGPTLVGPQRSAAYKVALREGKPPCDL